MVARLQKSREERIGSAAAVIAIHALIGWALVQGFGVHVGDVVENPLKVFNVSPEVPPPPLPQPPPPQPSKKSRVEKPKDEEGAAAPPAKKDTPSEIVAPKPILPVPPPIVAAPVAGRGAAAKSGAAPFEGPGTGTGGVGNGTGSGLYGNGPGGGGGGRAIPAQMVAGRIESADDYPRDAVAAHAQGVVEFRFTILTNGRIADCAVTRSSGNRSLDRATCDLALQRFRFRPALNSSGQPVPEVGYGEQEWELGRDQPRARDDGPGDGGNPN